MSEITPKYIRLTRNVVSEMFDECNRLYFNNAVERPLKIETWTPHKRTVGMVRPIWSANRNKVCSVLCISRRYRWTADNLRKVVVHEIIHLAIEDYKMPLTFLQRLPLIGRFFIKEHDDNFMNLMNGLNEEYGLDITVRMKQMRKDFIR